MTTCRVEFASSGDDVGAYRLLQLPDDLIKRLEAGEPDLSLIIKGRSDDDAVICTQDKSYALRQVVLSNTLLVVGGASSADADAADIVIRDQLSSILEMVPVVPKISGRLTAMLKDSEYREGNEDESDGGEEEVEERAAKRKRVFYDEVMDSVQASDAEVIQSITAHHVLTLDGELRPLEHSYLAQILRLLLNAIVAQSMSPDAALIDELVLSMQEQDVAKDANIPDIAREIGLDVLRTSQDSSVERLEFMNQWSNAVGESFTDSIDIKLLEGNCVVRDPGTASVQELVYLPRSSLPTDPGLLFNDLFLVKPRWQVDELAPFLRDVAVDSKARDKLVLKWCRTTTDGQGINWLTLRAKQV
ncbi:sister chromatid cohesion protein Dcc1 [Auriculariales sp. MPI-PUGE-AT-0066]|nr:sister chromatid cohesion protein Dcc1 [Auriculariales sp. MPI-PUGE-AT-0066]